MNGDSYTFETVVSGMISNGLKDKAIFTALSGTPGCPPSHILQDIIDGIRRESKPEKKPSKEELQRNWAKAIADAHVETLACTLVPVDRRDRAIIEIRDPETRYLRPASGEELHQIFQDVVGHPLSPADAEGIIWYLSTAYLKHRGAGKQIERGICFDNFLVDGSTGEIVTDQDAVARIRVRRPLLMPEELPKLSDNPIIQSWEKSYPCGALPIMEFLARTIDPHCCERSTEFLGGGGDGKTQIAEFAMGAVGEENALRIRFQDLATDRLPRVIHDMKGKLIVYAGDSAPDARKGCMHVVKELCTASFASGTPVYKCSETFPFTANLASTGNEKLRLYDHSNGAYDRELTLIFNSCFRGTDREVKEIYREWLANEQATNEIVSAAFWMAVRRRKAGRDWFVWPDRQKTKARYRILANVESKFLMQCFAPGGEHDFVTSDEIHELYRGWWKDSDHRPAFSMENFLNAGRLCFGVNQVDYAQKQTDGVRRRGVFGIVIQLRESEQAFDDDGDESENPSIDEAFSDLENKDNVGSAHKMPRQKVNLFIEEKEKNMESIEKVQEKNVGFSVHSTHSPGLRVVGNPGLDELF